ncbi:5'-3' exoribonuclease 2 homolog isoform X2 [Neocloeon triangulifer]|uniref:5'-3' exoribonuclease 2 homolog isoform X2 n=1 Tax=Neocloeon triangulifer TaxID=2078957 RepID=UPI00286EBEDF|nr:5'-3' exoribonuclease 2 homolog isoform X2 [Neocloeon triangulifer]
MGVPAFFRWLSRKYPSVIVDCVEQQPIEVDGVMIYPNAIEPNPNNVEFDNLYLDMNGIIHPCTHPENKPAPKNEEEMMIAIFECIDRLFRIVRPRKVLYMAIDGVAPRAKMNQQRSRRFRASKETGEKIEEIARIRDELRAKGVQLPPEKQKGEHFDSNCITPGTPFMARLSECLHYYIHDRLNNDPGWQNIKVILSDANVPGEGEHKIMDFIRRQRAQPDHDPNTQHVLCGADADLIMLGLATHEPNFTIIREEFKPNQPRPCEICGQVGHEVKDCAGVAQQESKEDVMTVGGSEPNFIFVRLSVLREYLEKELQMPNLPFKFDLDRAIDDWVFMCFFVGNDFLPHLPSLEIREGAIDRLVTLYKQAVYKTGGWLTDSGDVSLDRVQLIMTELGEAEDSIFKKRQETEKFFREKNKKNRRRERMMKGFQRPASGQFAPQALGRNQAPNPVQNARQEAFQMRMQGTSASERQVRGIDANTGLNAMLRPEGQGSQQRQGRWGNDGYAAQNEDSNSEPEPDDEVRLWEDGFKDRYYASKFGVEVTNIAFRHKLGLEYVLGLCWVLKYYYQGCASWKWYFPHHYAPFASDFVNIAALNNKFEKNTLPFRPLEQLMGVFPAASSSHVPEPWAELMSDPHSEIIDFYPTDFKIDLNGKKFAWQGVALLPFVDETRLFPALEPYYEKLTEAEKRRNVRGDDRLYVSNHHSESNFLNILYESGNFEQEFERVIEGVRGNLLLAQDRVSYGGTLRSPLRSLGPISGNRVVCVRFRDPKYDDNFIFPAKRLPDAIEPPRVLKPGDYDNNRGQWRPQLGMAPSSHKVTMNQAGFRMIRHGAGGQFNNGGGQSNNQWRNGNNAPHPARGHIPDVLGVPPPQERGGWGQRGGYQGGQHRGGFQQRGGGGGGYEGRSQGYSTREDNRDNRDRGGPARGGQGHSQRFNPYQQKGGDNWRNNQQQGYGGGGGGGGGQQRGGGRGGGRGRGGYEQNRRF